MNIVETFIFVPMFQSKFLILVISLIPFIGFTQKKIAIIGGGISGIAAAHELYLIDPNVEITLFEKENVLGGNARSFQTTNLYGEEVFVDMGPQYFAEGKWKQGPWENYVQLLKLLKYYNLYDADKIYSFKGTIAIMNNEDEKPDFVSPKEGKKRGGSLGQLMKFGKLYKRAKQIYLSLIHI